MSTAPPVPEPPADGRPTSHLPSELEGALGAICLEGSPADREPAIQALVDRHPQLAAAIRTLAADLVAVTALLETASVAPAAAELSEIGGYRVLRALGEGAFGAVYLCRQETPVIRNVAVKVLRAGWVDRRVLARFETERQLLAELSHPAITQEPTMKTPSLFAAALVATLSASASASPDCTTAPKSQWMPEATLKQKLEADGYAIRKFKASGNCYEIYGLDKSGNKVEIYVDPVDGRVVKEKRQG